MSAQLRGLSLDRVLNDDPREKRITLLCRCGPCSRQSAARCSSAVPDHAAALFLRRIDGSDERAIVTLSRRHFPLSSPQALLAQLAVLETSLENDVYSKVVALIALIAPWAAHPVRLAASGAEPPRSCCRAAHGRAARPGAQRHHAGRHPARD